MKKLLLLLFLIFISAPAFGGGEPFKNGYGFVFHGEGVTGTATKNTSTNIDYKILETSKISGVRVLLKDHQFGDSMSMQVVDVDNILGYGAGFVVETYGHNWNIDSENEDQGRENMIYAAEILVDLYLRIIYTSTSTTTDVEVKINYYLHKVP